MDYLWRKKARLFISSFLTVSSSILYATVHNVKKETKIRWLDNDLCNFVLNAKNMFCLYPLNLSCLLMISWTINKCWYLIYVYVFILCYRLHAFTLIRKCICLLDKWWTPRVFWTLCGVTLTYYIIFLANDILYDIPFYNIWEYLFSYICYEQYAESFRLCIRLDALQSCVIKSC